MAEAVIFDMDGVLVDSEALICSAAIGMFAELGVQVDATDFVPFVGAGENRYIGGVAEKYGTNIDLPAAKARTYALYLESVPKQLKILPGVRDLLLKCRETGWKMAVASSADWIKIQANLDAIGFPVASWDTVVSGEDLVHLKPSPDIFLQAAEQMHVSPSLCVVVEDAVNGVEAAKSAGMRCVAVETSFSAAQLGRADCIRPSIAAVTMQDLQGDIAHEE